MERLIPFVGVALFALVVIVITRLLVGERRRKEERAREAARLGFRAVIPPDPAVVDRIVGLHRRKSGSALEVRDLFRREGGDRVLYLFDLADTSGEDTDLVCDRAVLIVAPGLRLPRCTLRPQMEQEGLLARAANWMIRQARSSAGPEIEFPSPPEFGRRYALMAADEHDARRFFTAGRLARLAETRFWMVEGEGDGLTLDRLQLAAGGRRPGPVELAERLRDAERAWEIFAGEQ